MPQREGRTHLAHIDDAEPTQPIRQKGRASKLDAVRHLLGTTTDRAIGDMVGMTAKAVGNYRRRHGLPSFETRGVRPEQTPQNISLTDVNDGPPHAWGVQLEGVAEQVVVIAPGLVAAARACNVLGQVQCLRLLGPVVPFQ